MSKTWQKTLPYSKIVYPEFIRDRFKYIFWRIYTPFHPLTRNIGLHLGIVSHSGRQRFPIGKIAPEYSIKDIVDSLIGHGYGNHFIAWKDEGEIVGLRRVVNFKYQYHLRIFQDGEVRGHYEYTPECHPILHFKAIDQTDSREEFLKLLEGKIIPY